ncbi:helix-turn-helix transcriptional regulator [uncultured Paracoccus sp.]|uniref:helix-turn-helix domain-containing protein n=2 Tax=Paracoccus TaxID=265 RepID=UPI0030DB667D
MSFVTTDQHFSRIAHDPGRGRNGCAAFSLDTNGQSEAWPFGAVQQFSNVSFRDADTRGERRLRDACFGDVGLQPRSTGQGRVRGNGCCGGGVKCLHGDNVCIKQTAPSTLMFAHSNSRNNRKRVTPKPMKYRIKELRQARGWTQEQLADLAGTNKGYISQLESGKREPSAETLRSLAAAFNVEAAHMIESSAATDAATVRMLTIFEQLSPEDQAAIQHMAERLLPKNGG